MLPAFALLLSLSARAQAQPAATETVGRIGDTRLCARIDVPGLTTDERSAKVLQQALGPRGIVVGSIPGRFATLVLIADKETGKHLSDPQWRDLNLAGSGTTWKYFDAHGMPCGEASVQMDGSGSHDFHAFAVRGGYRFDLCLSESISADHPASFQRDAFERIAETFRLGVVRLGTWAQMPPDLLDRMDAAFRQGDNWNTWLTDQSQALTEDYTIPFTRAEILRFHGAAPAEQAGGYARARDLLDARRDLDARERLALAASEHGLGLALLDTGDAAKALPHLESALKIAHDLTAPVRGEVGYDLARAHARLGHVPQAIDCLKESESQSAGAVARARKDADFEETRKSKLFQALVDEPR